MVRLKMGSPVFFRQQRPGKDGTPFEMIKLRSMLGTVDSRGEPLPDDKRLTRLGKFLRSTSIDEFPALCNVIKGEMSLVGPRPLLMEYLSLYNEQQNRRHDVKSGITGWARVNGRNAIGWEDKFELDVWYVENRSLLLDFKILFLTVWKVPRRDRTPRTDLEAMSMGRPVITKDAPGCRETVRNGKNGFLVPV